MNTHANKGLFCSKAAFTLIELLVVVLIIGILAAVAVPQYQKAVEKSRVAEAMQLLKSLRDAQALCLLEHGTESEKCGWGEGGSQDIGELFDNISIDIPGTMEESEGLNGIGIKTKDFLYGLLTRRYSLICAERNDLDYHICTTAYPQETDYYNRLVCSGSGEAETNCNRIGFREETDGGWIQ